MKKANYLKKRLIKKLKNKTKKIIYKDKNQNYNF